MAAIHRRAWLAGAVAFGAIGDWATARAQPAARPPGEAFDYLMVGLPSRSTARSDLIQVAQNVHEGALSAGGRLLGAFAPQIGWTTNEAALLLGWPSQAADREAPVRGPTESGRVRLIGRDRLTATARPESPLTAPPRGGIFVHRWFAIAPSDLEPFVELSVLGWRDFEARFETQIYGLFTAARTSQDIAAGETRLLLITRYRDHGVWEQSRDPSTEAMAAFGKRQQLTLRSWAASSVLVAPPP